MMSNNEDMTTNELASNELLQEILSLEKNVTLKHLEQIGVTYKPKELIGENLSHITICYGEKTIDVTCRQGFLGEKYICDFQNDDDKLDFQGFLFSNYHLILKNKINSMIKKLLFIIPITALAVFAIHSLEPVMMMLVLRTILFLFCALVSYPIGKYIVSFINDLFKGEC